MELMVDRDLYHLSNVLFDLDNYHFDSDVQRLLNELMDLVQHKLLSNFDFDNYDIDDLNNDDVIFKFYAHIRKNK